MRKWSQWFKVDFKAFWFVERFRDRFWLVGKISSNLIGCVKFDKRVIYEKTVEEPKGWIDIPIRNDFGNPIHTWMIQIVIKQNHQSGRDSHLRQGFGHWIHFPISDLFSIGRREITRKKNGLLEFNSPGVYIFGAVARVCFYRNNTCYANTWIFNDQWKVRILGPESSPENINCFDDQWTIIR